MLLICVLSSVIASVGTVLMLSRHTAIFSPAPAPVRPPDVAAVRASPDEPRAAAVDAVPVRDETEETFAPSVPAPAPQPDFGKANVALQLASLMRTEDAAYLKAHSSLRDHLKNLEDTANAVINDDGGDAVATKVRRDNYVASLDDAIARAQLISTRETETPEDVAMALQIKTLLIGLRGH
jgi:hypothetical protein